MIYLYPNNDTFTIYIDKSYLSEKYHSEVIEIESLPEGEGILRRTEGGEFYYEPYPVEPLPPEPEPVETIEEKLARIEQQLEARHMQDLILLDVNMTIYEELLLMQDKLNNA